MAQRCNVLAGNDPTQLLPLLEIPLGGLTVLASTDVVLAFTGIGFRPRLNNQPVEAWRSLRLRAGDLFSSGFSRSGARAYLAVQGGFGASPVLGSVATVARERVGGFDGQAGPLCAGQLLPHGESSHFKAISVPYQRQPRMPAVLSLALVAGAQWDWFVQQAGFADATAAGRYLASRLFQISQQADRMGVRLRGAALPSKALPLYSEALVSGAVQLPPDGLPLVMLADHQTIGGYPKLGALTRHSTARMAQALPGQWVRFELIDAAAAIASERSAQQQLQAELQEYWRQWQA